MIDLEDDDKAIPRRLANSFKGKDRQDKNIIIQGSLKYLFDSLLMIQNQKLI